MQVIGLVEGFEIQAKGKLLTDLNLTARRNKSLDWTGDYSFTNIPSSYIDVIDEDEFIIAPIIDDLILPKAGEPHFWKGSVRYCQVRGNAKPYQPLYRKFGCA